MAGIARPRVIVWQAVDECPSKFRFRASVLFDGDVLPVVHYGSTAEAAREAAQTFWDDQLAKARAYTGGRGRKPSVTPAAQKVVDAERAAVADTPEAPGEIEESV